MKITCCWMYAIGRYGFPPSVDQAVQAIHEMADMGFENIELEGVGFENLQSVIDSRERLREACREARVRLSNFAIVLPELISADEAEMERAMTIFERGVKTAVYLESPFVWIDSHTPPVDVVSGQLLTDDIVFGQEYQVRIPDDFDWNMFWDRFVYSVSRCNQIAKENGVQLLIEPRVGETTSNSEALLRLVEAVADDNFGLILDTAHQHAQKEMLPLSVEKLGKRIRYVHVADNDGRMNWHHVPGSGTIDWEGLFLALKKQGYDGYYAIDLERLPQLDQKFLEAKRFLEVYASRLGL
jgi:sugar phosphate isomerase/epimerase